MRSAWGFGLVLSCVSIAAAVDHSGAAYEMSPAVVNGGGAGGPASPAHLLANGLGEIGLSGHASTSYLLLPSFAWTFSRPSAVSDLEAAALGTSSVSLSWSAPALDGNRGDLVQDVRYFIQYSTFASPALWRFESAQIVLSTFGVASGAAQSRALSNLSSGATVYFRLWTVDMNAGLSEASNLASAALPGAAPGTRDLIPPAHVPGFAAAMSSDGAKVQLVWSDVTLNQDKSDMADLWGYRILRSTTMGGVPAFAVDLPAPATSYVDAVGGGMYYYQILAMDLSGNLGGKSQTVTSENDWRSFFNGDSAMAAMENSAAKRLLAKNNASGRDLRVMLTRHPEHESGNIARSFSVDLIDAQSEEPVSPDALQGESLNLLFSYGASTSMAQTMAASGARTAAPSADMTLYYQNGTSFIPVSSLHDRPSQSLSLTTPHFGSYQIRQTVPPAGGEFSLTSVRPRIVTPNGDGRNDMVFFFFNNPRQSSVRLRIVNVNGRRVADVSRQGPSAGSSLAWDGRDAGGGAAPAGVYVYILEAEGTRFAGTVVVAR